MKPTAIEKYHQPRYSMHAHRHRKGHAALVLEGSYEERSVDGKFDCRANTLIVYPPWHLHEDNISKSGAVVLNFPIPPIDGMRVITLAATEELAKLAHQCLKSASCAALEESALVQPSKPPQWLDEFIADLAYYPNYTIEQLAHRYGVSTKHAIRCCKNWFGLTPVQFSKEKRVQKAIRLLRQGGDISSVAYDAGFSDQPHLTRTLTARCKITPANVKKLC